MLLPFGTGPYRLGIVYVWCLGTTIIALVPEALGSQKLRSTALGIAADEAGGTEIDLINLYLSNLLIQGRFIPSVVDMAEDISYVEFMGTENCALCRGQFPLRTAQGPDSWQSHFRAGKMLQSHKQSSIPNCSIVLCLDPKDEGAIEVTDVATLPNIHLDIAVTLAGRPRDQTVTICHDPLDIWKDRIEQNPLCIAFCVHSWCYAVLMWKVPEFSISNLYRLARSLIQQSSIWENICEDSGGRDHSLDHVGSLRTIDALVDDSLAVVPLPSMWNLPLEVRTYIWEHVGILTPYSAFLLVAGETSRLANHLNCPVSREVVLKPGSYLSAKMVTVFGTEFIQDLTSGEEFQANSKVSGVILGLKFVASLSGICAIKAIGCDWETDWIGKIPRTGSVWYGMVRGTGNVFYFNHSDLNCANDITSLDSSSANQIMWDQPNFPSIIVNPKTALFDYNRDLAGFSSTVSNTSMRRFFRYLPLYSCDEYITSLTVYTTRGSVVGLEAHFRRGSRLLGFRIGCPQHFPLQENERIAYAWLRIYDIESLAFNQRSLAIQTTFGREYSFGPYVPPQQILLGEFKWILLKSKGCVSGFYYENPRWPLSIPSLGIADDGSPIKISIQTPHYYASPNIPPIAVPGYLFLSVALLSQSTKVTLCRVGNRCTGMMLDYVQGQTLVLGQWQNPRVSQHFSVYNIDKPGASKIYFRMSNYGRYKIVTDIGFLMDQDEVVLDSNSRVFDIETPIVWWFSESYDEILAWTGQLLEIPETSDLVIPEEVIDD